MPDSDADAGADPGALAVSAAEPDAVPVAGAVPDAGFYPRPSGAHRDRTVEPTATGRSRSVISSRRNGDRTGRESRLEEKTSAAYCVAGGLVGRRARRALPSSNFPEAFHRSGGLREKGFRGRGGVSFPVQVQGPDQGPRRWTGTVGRGGCPRPCRGLTERSVFRIQQAPGHGPDPIEKLKSGVGLGRIDRPSLGEKSEMSIDFLCGAVCDSPVVHSISPGAPVTLGEVCRN